MTSVSVTNIEVLNNPASFSDAFQFQITFECIKELTADLEWKFTYVGSAESEKFDQELDSVLVGPVPLGVNRFVFETPPPDHHKIPKQDILGVTVCLISCLYKGKEFIRIGYYVNNEYDDPDLKPVEREDGDVYDLDESDGEEEEDDDDDEDENNGAAKTNQITNNNDTSNAATEIKEEQKPATKTGQEEQPQDQPAPKKQKTEKDEEVKKKEIFQLPPNFTVDKIRRHILVEKPRITRFMIEWD